MTRLAWDKPGERFFETGVDMGTFYPSVGEGVPWNGLVAVAEAPEGGDTTAYYLDGIKFLNIPNSEDFAGTISAYNHPKEFAECDGTATIGSVLSIGQQPRKSFGFSYRTKVGNDILAEDFGHKTHLVYNVLVSPSSRNYSSTNESIAPIQYDWSFTTTPITITGYKPSAHLVVDSSNAEFITALNDILYGSDVTAPRLPLPAEVIALLATF